ncbi:MAG: succinylglutamate desuccinylase/aspartoacylase family protein [Colwellia sp.]|nr:succinylglutamate desuccinylase/aspartoacylase family protein [Colwellia sp.]
MKKLLSICALSFLAMLLVACTSTNESVNAQTCNSGNVLLTADFANGRMDECKSLGNSEYFIKLKPENTPINSSPWYAFKIQAKQATTIKVTMVVKGDKHRYLPKISQDGKTWQPQPYKINGKRLVMNIDASQNPVYISAQEIIDNQYYVDWANTLQNKMNVSYDVLGKSTQGRPIYKIESKGNSKEWLVVLGRQHPPEVTGALALFPFVETLLANNDLANNFRENYNVLVIPNINPDGVFMGNWRHNANGLDLNRDWIKFSQPEIRHVNNYLKSLVAKGEKIKFAIDFHSTGKDIFYTLPVNYGVEAPYFVKHWLGSLDKAMPNFTVIQQPGSKPDQGVAKQYFADNYNVHAITYEVGDETNRENIIIIAKNASTLLMKTMLSNTNHNKE